MNTEVVELQAKELNPQGGVHCPDNTGSRPLWSGHPRVFLDVARHGQVDCPYCGTRYRLKDGAAVAKHH